MSHDDFTPSPTLATGLARSSESGRPLYELVVPRRRIVDDLEEVPSTAAFLATRGTASGVERVGSLTRLQALWANPASTELFKACAQAPALRAIYVAHFKRLETVPLNGAPALEHLLLNWAPRLVDLAFLRELPSLRTLCLDSMKRIDLSTLPELPNITGLHIDGGMWSTLKVDSLEPLLRLPNLRYLRLVNVRPVDGRLQPLSQLSELREIYLPNFFDLEEVARLAGAFPTALSNTLTPVFAPREPGQLSTRFVCDRCGGAREMMTGKPAVRLCPDCDSAKYQKRIARWEIARTIKWS